METYTLGLALEDFLPVILSSAGFWLVSSALSRIDAQIGRMAQIGWLLITIGGVLKASWKLVMALTNGGTNIVFFDKSLFVWLAVGFVLLSYAISYGWRILYQNNPRTRIWRWPSVTIALFFVGGLATGFPDVTISTWRFIFLGMMTIANVSIAALLIAQARRQGQTLAAALLAVNIIIVFVLSGLARIPDQTIALQWTEQILNTIGQGAFLYAAWQLVGQMETNPQISVA